MDQFHKGVATVTRDQLVACAAQMGVNPSYMDKMWTQLVLDVRSGFITEVYAFDVANSIIQSCEGD